MNHSVALDFARGNAKVCFVTPLNVCNAKCSFCDIWKIKNAEHAPLSELQIALDRLYELGVRFVQFTGGEPLMYRELEGAVRHAKTLGMVVNVITNGSLLRDARPESLLAAGVDVMAISVDHYDPESHDRSRGIPGVWRRIEEAVRYFREAGLPTMASTVVARFNARHLREVVERTEATGFTGVGFTYPTPATNASYPIGRGQADVTFEPHELREALEDTLRLKAEGHRIFNSRRGIEDQLRRLDGEPSRYPCRAGEHLFFLDHHLQLNRCMVLDEVIGPIRDIRPATISKRAECDSCSMMCFREPSLFFEGLHSIPVALEHAWLALRAIGVRA